jgi:hypothetical protein
MEITLTKQEFIFFFNLAVDNKVFAHEHKNPFNLCDLDLDSLDILVEKLEGYAQSISDKE